MEEATFKSKKFWLYNVCRKAPRDNTLYHEKIM